MNKKIIFYAAIVAVAACMNLVSTVGAYAQNTFFPTKVGRVLVSETKDGNGKVEGYGRATITKVEGSGNNMTISYTMESLDKNRKPQNPPFLLPLTVMIKNGVLIVDLKSMFPNNLKDSGINMEVTGVPTELPGDMQPGQSLKDANATLAINMGIIKIKTTVQITDGKCLAIEDVTVPAGTFKCYKITQTSSTKILGKTITGNTITWMAPGIGNVKMESYNAKNKLLTSMELVEVN
jgi:hypothetical protein